MPTKICSSCRTDKPYEYFRNTRKTEDGKYPICKKCDTVLAKTNYRDREFVKDRMWLKLVNNVVKNQDVGKTVMKFNKGIWTRWLYSNPDFKSKYTNYLREAVDGGTRDMGIEAINPSEELTLSNLRITLREGVLEANDSEEE
jgi:hypothetical protein